MALAMDTDSGRHSTSKLMVVFKWCVRSRDSDLPGGVRPGDLPSHNRIFEFDVVASTVKEGGLQAANIRQISAQGTRLENGDEGDA